MSYEDIEDIPRDVGPVRSTRLNQKEIENVFVGPNSFRRTELIQTNSIFLGGGEVGEGAYANVRRITFYFYCGSRFNSLFSDTLPPPSTQEKSDKGRLMEMEMEIHLHALKKIVSADQNFRKCRYMRLISIKPESETFLLNRYTLYWTTINFD